MNPRAWIGGAVLVALGLFIAWIANNTYWDEMTVPTFPRGEAASNPFYAAERLTQELGASSEWRRTLGELPQADAVMLLTHWNWDLIENRRKTLERWVESGGRLILDSTLAAGGDSLESWSGLRLDNHFEYEMSEETEEETDSAEARTEAIPEPCRELELTVGESQLDRARETYYVCALQTLGFLSSSRSVEWALEDEENPQVIRVQIGKGFLTLINGTPFGNRELLEADNAALFVDAAKLHRGDHVVFVSEEKRTSLLQLIWLYGAPAVLLAIALVAVALWRNSTRFGPLEASPDPSRRSLAEQIRGTGQFALRVGGGRALHGAMVRALHEAARQRVGNYEALSRDEQISAIARLASLDADALAETMNFSGRRRSHEFKNAIALLDRARVQVIAHGSTQAYERSPSSPSRAHAGEEA
jgi:hypothetical protein